MSSSINTNDEHSSFSSLLFFDSSDNPSSIDDSNNKSTPNRTGLLNRILPSFIVSLFDRWRGRSSQIDDSSSSGSLVNTRLELMRMNGSPDQDFYVQKSLASKWINFVVPLTGRWEIFKRFMLNYERVCLQRGERTRLAVVLFENDATPRIRDDGVLRSQSELIRSMFSRLRAKYSQVDQQNDLLLVVNASAFSRSIGCELGAAQYSSDSLIFFVDVDIVFTIEFLLRARLNTIQFKQVYYPIVFSEYDPDDTLEAIRSLRDNATPAVSSFLTGSNSSRDFQSHFAFSDESGYWRQFGFGIVSVYNSDLRSVGGFDTSIIGWGKEDVDLYEKFIHSNLTVFRAIDVGLVHVFHKIECDPNLAEEQMIMCLGSKATSIASQRQLARLVLKDNGILLNNNSSTSSKRPIP